MLAHLARASTVELVKDILAIAHDLRRFAERLALLGLLTELALADSDTRHFTMLQHLEYATFVPRNRIRRMSMKEQPAFGQLLQIRLEHPRKVNQARFACR